jgi:ferric-dicitrate binding protein FerR (iron transport regulator)
MTSPHDVALDRAHELMMAALDGESSATDTRELESLLSGRPDLQAEWDRLRRVKQLTATMKLAQPPAEVWDRYSASVLHRAERGLAWILIAFGLSILGSLGAWRWLEQWWSAELPLSVRVATGALMLGVSLLIVSVGRERWLMHRRDPYSKGVIR